MQIKKLLTIFTVCFFVLTLAPHSSPHQNGGFWRTASGWVLPAIALNNIANAARNRPARNRTHHRRPRKQRPRRGRRRRVRRERHDPPRRGRERERQPCRGLGRRHRPARLRHARLHDRSPIRLAATAGLAGPASYVTMPQQKSEVVARSCVDVSLHPLRCSARLRVGAGQSIALRGPWSISSLPTRSRLRGHGAASTRSGRPWE